MSIISATAAAGSVGALLTGGSGSLLPYNVIVPDWAVSAMQALTATLIFLYASLSISQAVASLSPALYQGMTGVMKKKLYFKVPNTNMFLSLRRNHFNCKSYTKGWYKTLTSMATKSSLSSSTAGT